MIFRDSNHNVLELPWAEIIRCWNPDRFHAPTPCSRELRSVTIEFHQPQCWQWQLGKILYQHGWRSRAVSFNVKLHLWVSDVKAAAGGEGQKYNNALPSGQNSKQFLWNKKQSSPLAVCTSVLFSMTISMTVSMWKHWDDTMWKSSGVVQGLTRQQSKSRNGWVGGLSRCSFFLDQKFHSSPFFHEGIYKQCCPSIVEVWCDFETFLAFVSNLDYMMFHLVIWRGFSGGWSSFYIHYVNT